MYLIDTMKHGQLHMILGCMFSGKTSELLRIYDRYIIAGRKCMLIKYEKDIRYDSNCIATHNGLREKSYKCNFLASLDKYIGDYDIILIDEIQFYKDAILFCEKWTVVDNKIVYVSGLNGTYNRLPFEVISMLLPLADSVKMYSAVCRNNGNNAIYSKRLDTMDTNIESLGAADKYEAVDRDTYFKDEKLYKEFLTELKDKIKQFCKENNITTNMKI